MPKESKNIIGQKFNRLTAIKLIKKRKIGQRNREYWLFRCDCGNEKVLKKNVVTCQKNPIMSCGCLLKESAKRNGEDSATHGMSKTLFYKRWNTMKQRCFNPNVEKYSIYGGRGIRVCEKWIKFENFMKDMHKSFLEHCQLFGIKNTIFDRVDNDGNYYKENCRWVTHKQSVSNRKRCQKTFN